MADDQVEVILVANFNGNPRVQWTRALHERFVIAVTELGGPYVAKPKAIKDTMRVRGLTLRHIKSHLQKYRSTLASAGSKDGMNEKQPKGNNDPLPHAVAVADDMGGHEFSAVADIKTGTGNLPIVLPHYDDNGGNEFHDVSELQTGTKGITSTMSTPYNIGGPGAYGVSEVPIGTEDIPYMLHDPYDIGNQTFYDLLGAPIGTEEIPEMMPQPAYNIGSNEVYDISGLQIETEGIQEPEERYANTFTDGTWKNDAGTQLEDYVMNFSSNILPLPNWDPTSYAIGDQNVYRESTTLLGREGRVNTLQEEQHNYTGSLDNGSNKKEKGIMKVQQQDVVAHHWKYPNDNMPLYNMMATPYGKGGHEFYSGSSVQREIGGGVQQASKVDKHAVVHDDANSKYMVSPMEQAYHWFTSV